MESRFFRPSFLCVPVMALSLISGCSLVQPAQKSGPDDDMAKTLLAVTRQMEEVTARLSALESASGRNGASIETLSKDLAACREQVKTLAAMPVTPAVPSRPPVALEPSAPAPVPAKAGTTVYVEPQVLYQEAMQRLGEKNSDEASRLFKEFVKRYPKSDLADNSLYWLGECYYSQKKYPEAVTVFKDLVDRYPDADKVPDALLKTAYSYMELEDLDRASHYLKRLVKHYPFTPAGEKAEQKLKLFH